MRIKLFSVCATFLFATVASGDDLPDLGDVTVDELSRSSEIALGAQIMRRIRGANSYVSDPEVTQYLNDLGYKLVSSGTEPGVDFDFFLINDNAINAFALPGGHIGVHSGLFLSSGNESELAGVMSHEIAHVQQRHIVRMLAAQRKLGFASLAGLAVAILASRSNAQVAGAAVATSQAAPLQAMLGFSRDHEREADRIGITILSSAGFDPSSSVNFFDRLYRETRIYQGNLPGYLQTHPLTLDRMADLQARLVSLDPHPVANSLHYTLVKSRIYVLVEGAAESKERFDALAKRDEFIDQVAGRYGRAVSLLSLKVVSKDQESVLARDVGWLLSRFPNDAMILALAAESKMSLGDLIGALGDYEFALKMYPSRLSLVRGKAIVLQKMGDAMEVEKFLNAALRNPSLARDRILYEFRAEAYRSMGYVMKFHFDLSMSAYLSGNLDGAINQLKIASDLDTGDFYFRSQLDSRLKDLLDEKSALRE